MSLAARCTHCRTVFRITGAQLAAAQGWVRCGGCSQVFDAASNLVTPSGQALEVPTVTTPEVAHQPTAAPLASVSSSPTTPFQAMPDIDLELPDLGALKAEANAAATSPAGDAEPAPIAAVSAEQGAAVSAVQPAPAEPSAGLPAERAASSLQPAEPSGDQREPFWVDGSRPTTAEQADESDARTSNQAERIAPHFDASADLRGEMALGSGPAKANESSATPAPAQARSNGLTGLAVMLLALTLASLVAYTARGHVAQTWPEARPLVLKACVMLGCQLPPIRQLEAVKIEGSSLSRDDASGHHRLRVQLRNGDEAPVWMPAFDLTLVDAQGEVLARRMIDPLEFQPALMQLDPGVEAALSVTLDLRALDPASVSSFRLSAYYP